MPNRPERVEKTIVTTVAAFGPWGLRTLNRHVPASGTALDDRGADRSEDAHVGGDNRDRAEQKDEDGGHYFERHSSLLFTLRGRGRGASPPEGVRPVVVTYGLLLARRYGRGHGC